MSKVIAAPLQTHLDGEYLTTATLWKLTTADGLTELFFTDHDADILHVSEVYKAASGYTRSALSGRIELNVDNTEVDILLDDLGLDAVDIRNGVWDNAKVTISTVDYTDALTNAVNQREGTLGEMKMIDSQMAFAELRGLTQKLSVNLADEYSPDCRLDLGDADCQVVFDPPFWTPSTFITQRLLHEADEEPTSMVKPIQFNDRHFTSFIKAGSENTGTTEPAWNLTIGGTTIDNDITWITTRARTIEGVVATVASLRKFTITYTGDAPDDFLQDGVCKMISGVNKGARKEVKKWTLSSNTVELFLPLALAVEVGDKVEIRAGCDKIVAGDCKVTFDNVFNFDGEPYVPGTNVTLNFPDAR